MRFSILPVTEVEEILRSHQDSPAIAQGKHSRAPRGLASRPGPSPSFLECWSRGRRALLGFLLAIFLLGSLAPAQQELVAGIEVHGNRRIPAETIRARIFTRPGDVYDEAALERDFNSLWNTGYFEDIRFERENTPKGPVIHIYVKERPTIREINYEGLNSVTKSDVLDRFKERKVGLCGRKPIRPHQGQTR